MAQFLIFDQIAQHPNRCKALVNFPGLDRLMLAQQSRVDRQAADMRGREAEASVAMIWQARGFSVLAQRLRTKSGEIDLVVADPATLVFVEVKARRSFDDAAYAVLPRQQSRLMQAAGSALALHEEWNRPNIRFDIALVCDGAVEHIEDAIRQN